MLWFLLGVTLSFPMKDFYFSLYLGYFFVAATIPQKSGFTVQMTCGSDSLSLGIVLLPFFSLSLALPFSTLRTSSPHIFINNIFQIQVRTNTKIDQDKNCKSIVVCKQKETNNVDKYDSQEAEESSLKPRFNVREGKSNIHFVFSVPGMNSYLSKNNNSNKSKGKQTLRKPNYTFFFIIHSKS